MNKDALSATERRKIIKSYVLETPGPKTLDDVVEFMSENYNVSIHRSNLSKDLRKNGLRFRHGYYQLDYEIQRKQAESKVASLLDLVEKPALENPTVVVVPVPGKSAQSVAAVLEQYFGEIVLGTIYSESTVHVFLYNLADQRQLKTRLYKMLGVSEPDGTH